MRMWLLPCTTLNKSSGGGSRSNNDKRAETQEAPTDNMYTHRINIAKERRFIWMTNSIGISKLYSRSYNFPKSMITLEKRNEYEAKNKIETRTQVPSVSKFNHAEFRVLYGLNILVILEDCLADWYPHDVQFLYAFVSYLLASHVQKTCSFFDS